MNFEITRLKFDTTKLIKDYQDFITKNEFVTDDKTLVDFNAICINRKEGDESSVIGGNVRGKYWTYPTDTAAEEERLEYVDEEAYNEICPEFAGTYTEEVYNECKKHYKLGRMRFLMKPPRSCLSWHRDPERRLHIPIITNLGCRMVIENEAQYMSTEHVYITDNTKYHNFFNGGEENRVHIVATILE